MKCIETQHEAFVLIIGSIRQQKPQQLDWESVYICKICEGVEPVSLYLCIDMSTLLLQIYSSAFAKGFLSVLKNAQSCWLQAQGVHQWTSPFQE